VNRSEDGTIAAEDPHAARGPHPGRVGWPVGGVVGSGERAFLGDATRRWGTRRSGNHGRTRRQHDDGGAAMTYHPDLTLPTLDPAAEIRIMRLLIRKHPDRARQAVAELDAPTDDATAAGDP
jgi:hypothetical protein